MKNNAWDRPLPGIFTVIREEVAERLFSMSGLTTGEILAKANSKDFYPIKIEVNFEITLRCNNSEIECRNVIGIVPGKKSDEFIAYTAHADHLGIGTSVNGDSIYNGAVDNAVGCASLIELSRAFANLREPPDRSILFLAVTGEEIGLFGSAYYVQNPVYPIEKTLAVINIDGPLPFGKMKDFILFGLERSSLENTARQIAEDNDMQVTPDPMPEEGFYQRSDHYSFARAGVPGGMLDIGTSFEGKPDGWGMAKVENWLKTVYHHPSDEYSGDWEMESIVQIVQLAFQFGFRIAAEPEWPTWNEGQPFKKIRDNIR